MMSEKERRRDLRTSDLAAKELSLGLYDPWSKSLFAHVH